MVTLKNGNSVLTINEVGAEMTGFRYKDVDYLWTGDPEFWGACAPNLFPMTGALRDDKYILNGKEYFLAKHGFVRNKLFTVESKTEDSVVFLLTASDETKESFPYEFQLRISYILSDGKVTAGYEVTNCNDETMWFSIGSHDGFSTPEGINEYDLIFPQKETLNTFELYGSLLTYEKTPIVSDSDKMDLDYKYFENGNALVFKELKSKTCCLKNRKTGRGVQFDFPGATRFVIWSNPNAPFLCLEPWFGQPDNFDSDYDITHKEAIEFLKSGETFKSVRIITALEGK